MWGHTMIRSAPKSQFRGIGTFGDIVLDMLGGHGLPLGIFALSHCHEVVTFFLTLRWCRTTNISIIWDSHSAETAVSETQRFNRETQHAPRASRLTDTFN